MNYDEAEKLVLTHKDKFEFEKFFMLEGQRVRFIKFMIAPEDHENELKSMFNETKDINVKDYLLHHDLMHKELKVFIVYQDYPDTLIHPFNINQIRFLSNAG